MGPPPLRIDELSTEDRWLTLDVDAGLEGRYRDVSGWGGEAPASGLSIVLARLAFTRGRPLPPGGVLLEIELDSHATAPSSGRCDFRVGAQVTHHRSGHRFVRILTSLRFPDGKCFAEVVYLIRWPAS